MRYSIFILGFFLFFPCCSPNSTLDFQHEGEARCRVLIKELQGIENREQLLHKETALKKHFESLVDLMIAALEFQRLHPDDVAAEAFSEENLAELNLEGELRRIYGIEGGREIIERSQHEALVRLDGYERAQSKKKEKLKLW